MVTLSQHPGDPPGCAHVAKGADPLLVRYAQLMNQTSQGDTSRSLGKTVLAVLVLLIAAWIVIKLVIGIVAALFVPLLVIAAVIALVWAWRVLF